MSISTAHNALEGAVVDALRGGASFAALAKRHAMGPPGSATSDLGWFSLDDMVPEFSAVVSALSIGRVSDPVQTQYGWHVIRLNAVRNIGGATLEDPDLRERMVALINWETFCGKKDKLEERFGVTIHNDDIDPSLIKRTDLIAE